MKVESPKTIYLSEYQKPEFSIQEISLTFHLNETDTQVINKMKVTRLGDSSTLRLNGEELRLESVKLNGVEISKDDLSEESQLLEIRNLNEREFELEITNWINPKANTALDGLYLSGNIFCTQNEPEGFRRITYFIDRPDVMAIYTTKIIADKSKYPVLLSNGNLLEKGDLDNNQHYAIWKDPFPKPSYLYALVAGDLGVIKDTFKTKSGRVVDLEIYCDKGNESKCDFAMECLKKSMKWDEDRFGLEYDLDIYMIVAVDSFNMGAMENKGLNIFNSAYVLANPELATDNDFLGIESVIGHEYFHNWSGNRVTCRDWFQLTLKEGLTVFRDQEFSSDLNDRSVQRIGDVSVLRNHQFAEDAGPMSHPIKPSQYMEINNFYTATIYNKGAEVIRMIHTLLGEEKFQEGMKKYFELFDGQAVTTEDFIHAMSLAEPNIDFERFKNWYSQAGTPVLHIETTYNEDQKNLKLVVTQEIQKGQSPFFMPYHIGLVNSHGEDFSISLQNRTDQPDLHRGVLHLRELREEFIFTDLDEKPVLSLNRNFSAPVKSRYDYSKEELAFLIKNDSNPFSRYEATHKMAKHIFEELVNQKIDALPKYYLQAYAEIFKADLAPWIKAYCLNLPSLEECLQDFEVFEVTNGFKARELMMSTLAQHFKKEFFSLYEKNQTTRELQNAPTRALKNTCLDFLSYLNDNEVIELIKNQFDHADNMTDEIHALSALCSKRKHLNDYGIQEFYKKWSHETLAMQKWFYVQSSTQNDDTYNVVLSLEKDKAYDSKVPNHVRRLLGGFSRNLPQFHHPSGRGYNFIADRIIEIDPVNPQVASSLARSYGQYRRLPENLKSLMKPELEKIMKTANISKNVYEVVSKTLNLS